MISNQRIADKSMQKVTSRKKELGVQAHCRYTTTVDVKVVVVTCLTVHC